MVNLKDGKTTVERPLPGEKNPLKRGENSPGSLTFFLSVLNDKYWVIFAKFISFACKQDLRIDAHLSPL
jgi:hypothetical protein